MSPRVYSNDVVMVVPRSPTVYSAGFLFSDSIDVNNIGERIQTYKYINITYYRCYINMLKNKKKSLNESVVTFVLKFNFNASEPNSGRVSGRTR